MSPTSWLWTDLLQFDFTDKVEEGQVLLEDVFKVVGVAS
jgi:hypothetical protein